MMECLDVIGLKPRALLNGLEHSVFADQENDNAYLLLTSMRHLRQQQHGGCAAETCRGLGTNESASDGIVR